jgi:hypothetical protein
MIDPTIEQADHVTEPVQVWVDVDKGIASLVRYLNTIPGVRTCASCQGTSSYRPYVMVSWESEEARQRLSAEFDFNCLEDCHQLAYVHIKNEKYFPWDR